MSKIQSSKKEVLKELDDDEEYLLDEVNGKRTKKKMSVLNQKKLTKFEMDELLLPEDFKEDEQ